MEVFVWWEAPINMRVEWKCASMNSGGQCVMTAGAALMQLWFVSSWNMHTLEVSTSVSVLVKVENLCKLIQFTYICRWHCIQQCTFWFWHWSYLPG